MKPYVSRFIWLVLVPSLAVPLFAQNQDESGARAKVLALEHAWNQAEAFKDLKALDALFDNGLIYVDSDGTLMTKSDFLSHVKTAPVEQVVTESMAVRIFENTAIATGTYRAKTVKNGKPVFLRGRFVDTWLYRNGTWVCVAAQSTPTP